jgi:hypothetical protein
MLCPRVSAWTEETTKESRGKRWEYRTYIASLVSVAGRTRIGKVIRVCWPIVLLTDDVIYLTTKEGIILVDEAVFAGVKGAGNNLAAQASGYVRLTHGFA